jgi:hypothetical protein
MQGRINRINLPTNSLILNGTGTSQTGITGYIWTKKSGGAATLTNETTANLSVSGLVAGTYVFEFRVTDVGGFAFDEVTVNVSTSGSQSKSGRECRCLIKQLRYQRIPLF